MTAWSAADRCPYKSTSDAIGGRTGDTVEHLGGHVHPRISA
jgi:hypothetical protein